LSANVVDCTTTGSYCYLTLPDLAAEDWSCHLEVTDNPKGITYLPGYDIDGQCVNDWGIVPYSGGDLEEGIDWVLEEQNNACVFTFLQRTGDFCRGNC
jgi:hypothetical protein